MELPEIPVNVQNHHASAIMIKKEATKTLVLLEAAELGSW